MGKFYRILSVVIASCMFISIFASMTPLAVLAQDYTGIDNLVYTTSSSLMYPSKVIQTDVWGWGNMWNYTQKPDNSVNVAVTNSGGIPYCVGLSNNYFKLDGFHIRLNFDWGSIPTGYNNKVFYISLANTTQYNILQPAKPLTIKVDMSSGHIWLFGASPEVRMIYQPALLYSNTNSLDINVEADLSGGYIIKANNVVITATSAHMTTVATGLTNYNEAMLTFSTESGVTSNFDISSIHGGDDICLDHYYDFSDYKNYTVKNSMLRPNAGNNWWGVTYTDLAYGGTRVSYPSAAPENYTHGINKPLKIDGAHLKMNFNWDGGTDYNDRVFWVVFAPSNQRYSGQDVGLSFYFNMSEGFMRAQYGNSIVGGGTTSDSFNRIYNSALHNNNFKSIDIKIKSNGDGSYAMTINGFIYTITAQTMALATGINGNLDSVYASIAPAGGKLSYDIVSLKSGAEFDYDNLAINHQDQIPTLMTAIDKISQIPAIGPGRPACAAEIAAAQASYDSIPVQYQGGITNANLLTKAQAALNYVYNDDVMPKYVSDEHVVLEKSDSIGNLMTPDWFKTAIMVEVRLEKATLEGTLESSIEMLEHYQEMGVNCLWITPVFHKGSTLSAPNGYTSFGPQTIDPSLTGTTDYAAGWAKFATFVEQAHQRDIRILLDFVTWGVDNQSPLLTTNPELFSGQTAWGGKAYDWNSTVFRNWYKGVVLDIVDKTNIDGMRCDVEPNYTGYTMYNEIRSQALTTLGKKLAILGEVSNDRLGTYDAEQYGVMSYDNWDYAQNLSNPQDFYLETTNIVNSIKTGNILGTRESQALGEGGLHRFYNNSLSNHDFAWTTFDNNLLRVGYQAIFAPFIPQWYMGDEVNDNVQNEVLYYGGKLDRTLLETTANRYFYEKLKQYIRIRRLYPDVFNYYPINHRESNIVKVNVDGTESLQAYARYDANGNAILVVPNDGVTRSIEVTVPFADLNMNGFGTYTVTDLMTNQVIVSGDKAAVTTFSQTVAINEIGVYLVKGVGDDVEYLVYRPQINDVTAAWGWPGMLEWHNADFDKGITLDFMANSCWTRHTINHLRPLKVDGMHVAFDNINADRFGFFRLSLTNNSLPDVSGDLPPFSLRMYLEGNNKTNLYYSTSSGDYILSENTSDSTAMASTMSGRWDIRMYANIDGSYELFFAGKEYTIPKARMDEAIASGLDFNKAYFTITDINSAQTSKLKLDVISVHGGDQVCLDKYNNVSNQKKYAITESMLTPNSNTGSIWPIAYEPLPTGGTRITYNSELSSTYAHGINKALKFDGMQFKMKFNRNLVTQNNDKTFWIVIAQAYQRNPSQDAGLSFYFDMAEGFMRIYNGTDIVGGGIAGDTFNRIYNDAFKYSNFQELDMKITANGDGSYNLKLNGVNVYTISSSTMAKATNLTDLNTVHLSFAPNNGKPSCDLISLRSGAEFDYDSFAINNPSQIPIAIHGVQNGETYYYSNGSKTIYYDRGNARLNNVLFAQGDCINKTGDYSLVVTDYTTVTNLNFSFVKYGDVSGDGNIDIADLAKLKSHIIKSNPLTGAYKAAGSIANRGSATISISDLLTIKKHILNIATITQ